MQIRLIEEGDAEATVELYRAVYGDDFPFQQFYDATWVKKGVFDDSMCWLVGEKDGALLGSIAAMLEEWSPDLPYRTTDEGSAIGVYEIQQRQSGDKYLLPICQLRLTVTSMRWHLYWMRSFDAWWPYSLPKQGRKHTLRARLRQVLEDEFGCFWG